MYTVAYRMLAGQPSVCSNTLLFSSTLLATAVGHHWPTAVMAKWLEGQAALLTAQVRALRDCKFSVQCKVIALPAFYDAITGLTEFIISIVKSVKMVNMP